MSEPEQRLDEHAPIGCDGCLPWVAPFVPAGISLGDVLRRFRSAGIGHVSVTVAAGTDTAAQALSRIARLQQELRSLSDWVVPVQESRDTITGAARSGLMSVGMHFQTSTPMLDDLDVVLTFRSLGVTRALLAYNEANAAADGCHEPRNGGLTGLGRRLITRMNEVGMIVDLSHCAERTTLDAMEWSARPPFFSHSNARALFDHERNITDEQIARCAARGGYIGVNGVGFFLGGADTDLVSAMADHVIHVAGIAGIDNVGLGLDYMELTGSDYSFFHAARSRWPQGYPEPPWRFVRPEDLVPLRDMLADRGLSQNEIANVFGRNYLRHLTKQL